MKKKIICLFAVLICSVSAAQAENIDLQSMSVESLISLQDQIDAELKSRESSDPVLLPGQTVVVMDTEDLLIYFTGSGEEDRFYDEFALQMVCENRSDETFTIFAKQNCVNGWQTRMFTLTSDFAGKTKTLAKYGVYYKGALLESFDQVKEISFQICVQHGFEETNYGPFKFDIEPSSWGD